MSPACVCVYVSVFRFHRQLSFALAVRPPQPIVRRCDFSTCVSRYALDDYLYVLNVTFLFDRLDASSNACLECSLAHACLECMLAEAVNCVCKPRGSVKQITYLACTHHGHV